MAVILLGPWAYPPLIRAKARIFGVGLAYASVASNDGAWSRVLSGVKAGQVQWFEVAAILRPALDTHPGELMLDALAGAIEANPRAAVDVLLPAYGAELLCGQEEEGLPVSRERAQRRRDALRLRGITDADAAPCLALLERALKLFP